MFDNDLSGKDAAADAEVHHAEDEQTENAEELQPKRCTPWNTLSARVISLVSRKGGVGKTTSTVNLAAAFALSGHSVLIVGVDPQCGVSRSLGYGRDEMTSDRRDMFRTDTPLTHLVQTTPLQNLFFVSPSIWTLEDEEEYNELMEARIHSFVHEIDRARNLYDTILIDCPPHLAAPTRAALLASDSYLIPVQAEELCRDSLGPLLEFIETFRGQAYSETDLARDNGHQPLQLEGMFLTMVNSRTRMGRHVTERVTEDHGTHLFTSAIPRTTRLTEMALRGKPAVIYDRRSPGSRAYFNLADEILIHWLANGGGATGDDPEARNEDGAGEGERPDPAPEAPAVEAPSANDVEHVAGSPRSGLEKLWQELRDQQSAIDPATLDTASAGPEMVSLDQVLAEEESRAADEPDWDESAWNSSDRYPRRLN